MRKIVIDTIPHKYQNYPTAGDYVTDRNGIVHITVSYMKDWRYGFLVMLHELAEKALTKMHGIPEERITAFDCRFEVERQNGIHKPDDEPGDDKRAPYRKEHRWATRIEKMAAKSLDVDWKDYSRVVNSL